MKTSSKLRYGLTAAAVLASAHVAPGQNIWTGGGSPDLNWSNGLNWNTAIAPGSSDPVLFGAAGTVANATTVNNIANVSTIAGLSYTNVTSGAWHVTQIPDGATLSVNGNIMVGAGVTANSYVSQAAVTGGGTLHATGGNLNIDNQGSSSLNNNNTLDLAGLSTFIYDNFAGTISVGAVNRSFGILNLASGSNYIAAATLNFATGSSSSSGSGVALRFGAGTNIINATTFNLAANRVSGTAQFAGATGGLRVRGANGTDADRINMTLGHRNAGSSTGGTSTGSLLLNGHPVDMMIDSLILGRNSRSGTEAGLNGVGIFQFDQGVVDVTTLNMGVMSGNSPTATAKGTMTVGANGKLVVGSVSLANTTSTGAGSAGSGTLSISNGLVQCAGDIVKTTAAGTGNVILDAGARLVMAGTAHLGTTGIPLDLLAMTNSTATLPVTADSVNVVALSMDGANTINVVGEIPPVTGYPGSVTLIKYASFAGTFNGTLGTLPPSTPAYSGYLSNNTANGSVDLVLTAGPVPARQIVWSGASSADWNTTTANWKVGAASTTYNQKDFVLFNDTATGPTSINIAEVVTPSSITVSNNSKPYTFGGGASISGVTGITKDGSGTLSIVNSGLNDFSGSIEILAGTLRVGDGTSSGNLGTGSVINDGNLTFNYGIDISVPNTISGSGAVTKLGAGNVTLSAPNSYSGVTTVSQGILSVTDNSALGTTNGGTFVANGATLNVNDRNLGAEPVTVGGAGVGSGGAIINATANQQLNSLRYVTLTGDTVFGGSGRWDIRGAPSTADPANAGLSTGGNAYKLTKVGANQISIVGATVDPALGDIDIQGGILAFETATTSLGDPNRNVTVGAGGTLQFYNLTNRVNKKIFITSDGFTSSLNNGAGANTVIGPITINNDSYFNINGTSLTLEGPVTGAQIVKNGTGTLIYSGSPTHVGTTVNSGKLLVNGIHTGAVNVNGGALLAGSGTVGSVELNGAVFPGETNVIGTLTVQSMNVQGTIYMDLGRNTTVGLGSNDLIQASGQVTFNGGSITINPKGLLSTTPGTTYTLVRATGGIVYNGDPYISGPDNYVFTIDKSTAGSLKVVVTGGPAVWNGASTSTSNWSDAANWGGVSVVGSSPLYFNGNTRTVNNNDTAADTSYDIAFTAEAGAFTLNGNAVTVMNSIINNSANTQNINLPLSLGTAGTINGAAGTLSLNGAVKSANNLSILDIAGSGIFKNQFENAASVTNTLRMTDTNGDWTILDNPGSTLVAVPMQLDIQAGEFTFGSASSGPQFTTTSAQGVPSGDNRLGNIGGATATFNMVNGTLTTTARFNTGTAGNARGVVNMTGGTWYLGGQFQGANGGNTATSEFNISGGVLHVANYGATLAYQTFFVASRGNSSFNISDAAQATVATLDVSRSINSDITGTVNLNGGTLTVNRVGNGTSSSSSSTSGSKGIFNFNGGLLKAGASSATWFQGRASGPSVPLFAYVKAGGAKIDTAGFDVSFLEPLQHDAALGETADGGLIKSGAGALTLAAVNTYTGPTVVNGGSLLVNGSVVSPTVTVNDGGALGGTGTINAAVTVKSGGTATAGTATAGGTLTIAGNLIMEAGSIARMDLNKTNTPANDKIAATSITYAGTLQLNSIGGALAAGDSFQLFNATSYNGSFSSISPATPGDGLAWDTSALATTGTIKVVSGQPLTFGSFSVTGGNIVLNAANGPANGAYVILTSSDLSTPVSSWTQLTSGNFDANGTMSFTAPAPADPQRYYILKIQ